MSSSFRIEFTHPRKESTRSTFDRSALRTTFGEAADAYDRGRPSYPAALVAAVVARLPRQPARFLEVGCGSGQATRLFVPYALDLTALDMSAELLALAPANVQASNVRYLCSTFEAAPLPSGTYDVLIAAQSFHWINPAVGIAKAQDLLAPDGLIALFWNFAHLESQPYLRQCREHILTLAPHYAAWAEASEARFTAFGQEWVRALASQPHLGECHTRTFHWGVPWSPPQTVAWFTTRSWWRVLAEPQQQELAHRLQHILARHAHETFPFRSLLMMARCVKSDA